MESKKVAGTILTLSFRGCIMAVVVLFTILLARRAYFFGISIFHEYSMVELKDVPVEKIEIEIPEEWSDMDVAEIMEENGLADSKWLFWAQLFLSDHKSGSKIEPILPGTYELSTNMKPSEMMKIMSTPPEPEEETEKATKETK